MAEFMGQRFFIEARGVNRRQRRQCIMQSVRRAGVRSNSIGLPQTSALTSQLSPARACFSSAPRCVPKAG